MQSTLQEIIITNQKTSFFTGTTRDLNLERMPGKVTVCIGVRRCGKTTLLSQTLKDILDGGFSPENIVYINFFDDRLHQLKQIGLGSVLDAYYSLYPKKQQKEKVYFFFDEIQTIPGWEKFIDRLLRTEKSEIFLSGSSASMLSKEIATQMRGRSLSWELFPFSFSEYLRHHGIPALKFPLTTSDRHLVEREWEEYWKTGGFPEAIDCSETLRRKLHQEYFQGVLFHDLIERHNIAHPQALKDLTYQLLDNTGSLYSINKLYGHLKALNHHLQKSSVSQYIEWLEESFFLFSVRLFDASFSRSNANPKKIYTIDHALVRSISSGILINSGHLLENMVYLALRRITPDIYYYRTKTGKEVDFIMIKNRAEKMLFQVSETLASPQTRDREINALLEALEEQNLTEGTIVTHNESENLVIKDRAIRIIPAWQFLLEMS